MTLSNNLCKHFYIRSKLRKWRKKKEVCASSSMTSSLNMYTGENLFYRHAGVLVYILFVSVHIHDTNGSLKSLNI